MAEQAQVPEYSMSVGRDYRLANRYEYVVFKGEDVLIRAGCFKSAATARRAGLKAFQALEQIG